MILQNTTYMSLPSLKILYTVEESWIHVSEGTESTWRKGLSFFLFSSQQPAIGRCRCFVLILKQQPSACTLSTMVQKISWFNFRNQLAIFSHVSTDAWLSKSAHREIVSPSVVMVPGWVRGQGGRWAQSTQPLRFCPAAIPAPASLWWSLLYTMSAGRSFRLPHWLSLFF
jgi:hypothetical protein